MSDVKKPRYYTIDDFLRESMTVIRERFNSIRNLYPAQRSHVWNRLIREIEEERDHR